jgi:hypothetical protein
LEPSLKLCKQYASSESTKLRFHQQQHQKGLRDGDFVQGKQNAKSADGRVAITVNEVQHQKSAEIGQVLDVSEDTRINHPKGTETSCNRAAALYLKVYQRRFQGVTIYAFKFGRGGPGRDLSPHRTNMENAAHHRPAMRRLALLLRLSVFFFCWSGAHLGAGFAKT